VESELMVPKALCHRCFLFEAPAAHRHASRSDGLCTSGWGVNDQIAGEDQPDAAPNPVRWELGSGSAALDEAAGVAQATRLRRRRSHGLNMGSWGGKST
jgi:hypothetical protein